jgi:hypothetical protein
MKIVIETTQWTGPAGPNHIYVLEQFKKGDRSAKAVAYVPFGTGSVQRFKKPMTLDLKGRTFELVD